MFALVIAFGVKISSLYAEDMYEDDFIEQIEYDDYDDAGYNEGASLNNNVVQQYDEEMADQISAEALDEYDMSGSLFEKITMLEQEKVVVQLEKERAQLDLDLDRLNAERIKLQMELDTLSGRAEQQQHELETAKTQLEIQTERLRQQRDALDDNIVISYEEPVITKQKSQDVSIAKKYKLINVIGVDNQLQATVEELATGQNKRIAVGKDLDGYVVKAISLHDGIVFEKDGVEESLNIGK
jgi:regulator of replication initiation timing